MKQFSKICYQFATFLSLFLLLFVSNCRKKSEDPTPPANYPVLGQISFTEIKTVSARANCSITQLGAGADGNNTIKEYGICYSNKEKPTISDSKFKVGEKTDKVLDFSAFLSGLSAGSKYYVRGYVLHEGNPIYSEDGILTTSSLKAPEVSTGAAENITSSTFGITGNIANIGTSDVTQHGHVLSETNKEPTTGDTKTELGSANAAKDYKSGYTGLKPNTVYYVRAYATNTTGTGYGTVITVKTSNELAPSVTTGEASNISQSRVTVSGKVTDNGTQAIFQHGHVISETNKEPTIADGKTENGAITAPKDFTSGFASLNANTTYYVRAYARSSVGTSYGTVISFKTLNVEPPTVTTADGIDVASNSFNVNGKITAIGTADVTQFGHVISESNQNPTTADKNAQTQMGSTNAPKDFKSTFTGLKANTTYYIRAYATNAVGTSYSNAVNIKTANEIPPSLTTGGIYNVTGSSISIDGKLENAGTKPVTEIGHCYNKTGNPSFNDIRITKGVQLSEPLFFTTDPKNLEPNTTYYIRAYAKGEGGVGYGDVKQFTTATLPTVTTPPVQNYSRSTNRLYPDGLIVSTGTYPVTYYGVCISSTNQDPKPGGTDVRNYSSSAQISTTQKNVMFIADFKDIPLGTTYYLRAYAMSLAGTTYANVQTYRTPEPIPPTVTTNDIYNYTTSSISIDGYITNKGLGSTITEVGHCYSSSNQNPTIADSKFTRGGSSRTDFPVLFTSDPKNLTSNTTYYIRSYATSSEGTGYGAVKTFKTNK